MPPITKVIMKPMVHSIGDVEAHPPAVHREQPVEDLHARRYGDHHGRDAEEGVDVGPGAHREEVVQPHEEGKERDRHGGEHHGGVAEEALAREGGDDLGEDAERRQDEDVDLRVPPDPDEVDVHHRIAAEGAGEEVHPEIAIERQQRQRHREDRERRDDQDVGAEGGPGEHRHAHQRHAGRAHPQDGGDEVDAGEQSCRCPRSAAPRCNSRRRHPG